jgi:hypothetical protein
MADILDRWFGHWWEDPAVAKVFQDAVGRVLAMRVAMRVSKEEKPRTPLQPYPETAAAELFGDDPSPSTVAAALITLVLADKLDGGGR